MNRILMNLTHLLSESKKVRAIGEEQQRSSVFEWQTFIRSLTTACNFISA